MAMSLGPLGLGLTSPLVGARGAVVPLEVFARASTQRIDIVGIGDSNQILSGFGWDHGIQYALARYFPMHATGLISQNENNGSGSGTGYLYNRSGSLIGAVSGAPADLDKYLNKGTGSIFPAYYTYLANGSNLGSTLANGLVITGACPIDTSAAIAFDGYYGTFTTDAGQFRPFARWEETPFTTLSDPGAISTNTGAYSLQKVTVSATASAARAGKQIGMRWTRPSVQGITGPFFCTYMRARNTDRSTGFAYSTIEYRGGQSARTMAVDLQQASDDTLTHYFSVLRDDQQAAEPHIVIMVNSGLNDRSENLTSVGPAAIAAPDTASPAAFVDNCTAIVQRIQAIWTLNAWSQDELNFVFMVSHPISDPDDAQLVGYRSAIATYAASLSKGSVIDLAAKITSAQMLANGYYASAGADKNHLTQSGYEGMGLLAITATA
ncbi:MAG: hypothetical protein E5X86_22645 [Mesorhizobium sp.]|uniref:hypothetical protein n=1 Tax=Mesorhizobium sp. TaxID=1871066 RepID=UPI00120EEEA8|nr:hypothetical protein [Mesorhizobium sp.]TIO14921.1 MAG: hypothetical protein E5X86_22645 [Mesorhizobium sp.]